MQGKYFADSKTGGRQKIVDWRVALSCASAETGPHMAPKKYVSVETRGGLAWVTMAREPVNSMNCQFWEELLATLSELESDSGIRAVVWRSGLKRNVFTAGNDIRELYAPMTNRDRHRRFWVAQTRFLARLYRTRLITAAAIRGACPAGGCIMSLCCDYRAMADIKQSRLGLNEVALGIAPPPYWGRVMVALIGHGPAERLLKNATMVPAGQALRMGLVDAVVPTADLDSAAEKYCRRVMRLPSPSYALTKDRLRGELSRAWEAFADKEAAQVFATLSDPKTVRSLGAVLKRLSKGKKKKQQTAGALASDRVFTKIAAGVAANGAEAVRRVKATFLFNITAKRGKNVLKTWLVDLKNGNGRVAQTSAKGAKADCTVTVRDKDFVALMTGQLKPMMAFQMGKIKVSGNMMLALKLKSLTSMIKNNPKSKL